MCQHLPYWIHPRLIHISLDDLCLHWPILDTASINPYRPRWQTCVYTDYYWIQPRLFNIILDNMCLHLPLLDTASAIHISLDDLCLHWPILDTASVNLYRPRWHTCVYTNYYWIPPRLIHISLDDMCYTDYCWIQPRLIHISLDDMCLHWLLLDTASVNAYQPWWHVSALRYY